MIVSFYLALLLFILVIVGVMLMTDQEKLDRGAVFVAVVLGLIAIVLGPTLNHMRERARVEERREKGLPEPEETLAAIAADIARLRELAERERQGPHPP